MNKNSQKDLRKVQEKYFKNILKKLYKMSFICIIILYKIKQNGFNFKTKKQKQTGETNDYTYKSRCNQPNY